MTQVLVIISGDTRDFSQSVINIEPVGHYVESDAFTGCDGQIEGENNRHVSSTSPIYSVLNYARYGLSCHSSSAGDGNIVSCIKSEKRDILEGSNCNALPPKLYQ